MTLLAELRRRNVIRMAGLYLVGSWLVTQVAATVAEIQAFLDGERERLKTLPEAKP